MRMRNLRNPTQLITWRFPLELKETIAVVKNLALSIFSMIAAAEKEKIPEGLMMHSDKQVVVDTTDKKLNNNYVTCLIRSSPSPIYSADSIIAFL